MTETVYVRRYASPLGGITMRSDGEALTGLWFDGQRYAPCLPPDARDGGDTAALRAAARWLDLYFSGHAPDFTPPMRLAGTSFRRAVWERLLAVPWGESVTYGELAKALGCPSPRAVGGAAAHNPIVLIVPCHRLVGKGGVTAGYAGGTDRKEWLLRLEGASRA